MKRGITLAKPEGVSELLIGRDCTQMPYQQRIGCPKISPNVVAVLNPASYFRKNKVSHGGNIVGILSTICTGEISAELSRFHGKIRRHPPPLGHIPLLVNLALQTPPQNRHPAECPLSEIAPRRPAAPAPYTRPLREDTALGSTGRRASALRTMT